MPDRANLWKWIVFALSVGAFVPVAIGGWRHPAEINLASYILWAILTAVLFYSSRARDFAGWVIPLGYLAGNLLMLAEGLIIGGYTFNLGRTETAVLAGMFTTACAWLAVGQVTGRWSPRILFVGTIIADVMSTYPIWKQYVLPHEAPTPWMVCGWSAGAAGCLVSLLMVEDFFVKIAASNTASDHAKSILAIVEESAFTLESTILLLATVTLMIR